MKLPILATISAFNYLMNDQSDWYACLCWSYGATKGVIYHTSLICECFLLDLCFSVMRLLIYLYPLYSREVLSTNSKLIWKSSRRRSFYKWSVYNCHCPCLISLWVLYNILLHLDKHHWSSWYKLHLFCYIWSIGKVHLLKVSLSFFFEIE